MHAGRLLVILSLTLLFPFLPFACEDDDPSAGSTGSPQAGSGQAGEEDDDVSDDDDDDEAPDALSSASPGVDSAALKEDHAGWNSADCSSCHSNAHMRGFARAECVTCHGNNGAPPRKAGHPNADCVECHADAHESTGFHSPSDCRMCHGYEAVKDLSCPQTESFDVVVIGAGGGGLSTAAMLAQQGLSVVVLEQHYKVGGCMATFKREDYNFEVSLHAMDGLEPPDGMNRKMFEQLGILDKVSPVRLDPMYVSEFPSRRIRVPADVEEYRDVLKEAFPDESDNIDRLWNDMADYDRVFTAIYNMMDGMNPEDMMTVITHLGVAMRLLGLKDMTLADMLSEYTQSQELVAVWTQLALFLGVEPSRLSALMFTVMWNNYHRHGFYYFEGGSQSVVDALAQVVEDHGGEVLLGARALKIDIEEGKAARVRTRDDGCYEGRYFVSNANAIDTLENMVGPENLPADYLAAMDEMTIGLSPFTIYLGVDRDFGELFEGSHEIMFSETYDSDENVEYILNGDPDHAPGAVANFSAVDKTAAPAGKNVLQVITQLPYEWNENWYWEQGYDAYVDLKVQIAWRVIKRAEKYLPGLEDHIEVFEIATPKTIEAYTLNPRGTIFGWEHTIGQSLEHRLPNQTPIENLYLAGAWTMPGAGQSAVLQSGTLVAGMILEKEAK